MRIFTTVSTTGQTGVEMEALTAAAIAALTVYDMTKALDKAIEIQDLYLIEKTGGKSGRLPAMKLAVLTISDRAWMKLYKDESGPAVKARLESKGWAVPLLEVLPDERTMIEPRLRELCDAGEYACILTTGGTGPRATRRHSGGDARRDRARNARTLRAHALRRRADYTVRGLVARGVGHSGHDVDCEPPWVAQRRRGIAGCYLGTDSADRQIDAAVRSLKPVRGGTHLEQMDRSMQLRRRDFLLSSLLAAPMAAQDGEGVIFRGGTFNVTAPVTVYDRNGKLVNRPRGERLHAFRQQRSARHQSRCQLRPHLDGAGDSSQ